MLSQCFRGWHEPIEALLDASEGASILQNDVYDMDPLPRFVDRHVALLGDAAHAMTPNFGQGACQAIEDAVVLAACLKTNGSVDSALLEYQRRRAPRTRQVVLSSRRLGAFAQIESAAWCWMRDAAMRVTPKQIAARQMKSMLNFEFLTSSELALFGLRTAGEES